MKMSLSRCVWTAATAALLLLAPLHAAPQNPSAPTTLKSQYRELCQLIAVWDPNRTETSVVPEPPPRFVNPSEGPVMASATAGVTVNYSANFDPAAKAAFQAAVDLWATQIQSSAPVTIDANWSALGTGVLGQAGATFVYQNFGAG